MARAAGIDYSLPAIANSKAAPGVIASSILPAAQLYKLPYTLRQVQISILRESFQV
jgi:hypothetical protein